MQKFVVYVLLMVVVVLFAVDNMSHVEVGLIVGRPFQVRLFFLLLVVYLCGCFTTLVANMYLNAKYGRTRTKHGAVRGAKDKESEEETFFI